MSRKQVSIICLIGYFLTGCIPIMLAPALPSLISAFSLTLTTAGLVFSLRSAGSFLGVALGGTLSDRWGRKPLIVLGALVQGSLYTLVGLAPGWAFVVLGLGLAGFFGGLTNPSLNALMAETNSERRAAALNSLHGVYGLGAMLGSLLAGVLLGTQLGWRAVFFCSGLLWLVFGLVFSRVRLPAAARVFQDKKQLFLKPLRLFWQPIFLLLFAVSFIYNGSATSLVSWINTYLDQSSMPLFLGAGMVSIFYLGLSSGRFACTFLVERLGSVRLILLCAIGSMLFYPLVIFGSTPFLLGGGILLCGFFLGGLHPTGLALATRLYPEIGGTVASLLAMALTFSSMTVPWLIGLVADYAGFSRAFLISNGLLVLLLPVTALLGRQQKQLQEQRQKI